MGTFSAAGIRPLVVAVTMEEHGSAILPLHVVGWAELEDGSGWEAVVALGDALAVRVSRLEGEHGVTKVLGLGPAPPEPELRPTGQVIHTPAGMVPAGLAR